jgi:DNA-binding NarL/FixJ family response regulator
MLARRFNLTAREAEVMHLMSRGKSNKEISLALIITLATVKVHVTAVMRKLEVRSRTAAVARWYEELRKIDTVA